MALKVYQSQIRKLVKSPTDMDEVIKSERKLHDLGFVKFVSELDPLDRKMIEDSGGTVTLNISFHGGQYGIPTQLAHHAGWFLMPHTHKVVVTV